MEEKTSKDSVFESDDLTRKNKVTEEVIAKGNDECRDLIMMLKSELFDQHDVAEFSDNLASYIEEHQRLAYAVITKIILLSQDKEIECIEYNMIQLLNSDNVSTRLDKEILIKLYDHIQLACNQLLSLDNLRGESINKIEDLTKELNRVAEDNMKEIKAIQKEYIAILGIFAAIVLAFTNGLAFNTSVLNNLHTNNVYSLVIVAVLILQGSLHLVYMLLDFIHKIAKDNPLKYPQWLIYFDVASGIVMVADVLLYYFTG